jgi:3-dehydroquinate synthase II
MKEFWVDVRPWKKEAATAAIESGATALIVDDPSLARALSRIKTIGPGGDWEIGRDLREIEIAGSESQQEAIDAAKQGYLIVRTKDWTIIPLENLVAVSDKVIASVKTREEAECALGVLEKGTGGILLESLNPAVIKSVGEAVHRGSGEVPLVPFTVDSIRAMGMGDRVCVDTCSMMNQGQGILVGNTSSAFLLVHAETLENPYVAPRPFRVNAGAVHAYTLLPNGKTAYLSELKAGDPVLITDSVGGLEEAHVGRVKIERRPLLLVTAHHEGKNLSLVLQNAETIRLVREDGSAVSVVDLAVGDRVLGAVMEAGRHFGVAVKERIREI